MFIVHFAFNKWTRWLTGCDTRHYIVYIWYIWYYMIYELLLLYYATTWAVDDIVHYAVLYLLIRYRLWWSYWLILFHWHLTSFYVLCFYIIYFAISYFLYNFFDLHCVEIFFFPSPIQSVLQKLHWRQRFEPTVYPPNQDIQQSTRQLNERRSNVVVSCNREE